MHSTYDFFMDKRHLLQTIGTDYSLSDWRMKERLKTVSVALVLCLNIGIEPPDVTKTQPCSKLEAWIDPFSLPPQKALEAIGRNLQSQYEVIIHFNDRFGSQERDTDSHLIRQ